MSFSQTLSTSCTCRTLIRIFKRGLLSRFYLNSENTFRWAVKLQNRFEIERVGYRRQLSRARATMYRWWMPSFCTWACRRSRIFTAEVELLRYRRLLTRPTWIYFRIWLSISIPKVSECSASVSDFSELDVLTYRSLLVSQCHRQSAEISEQSHALFQLRAAVFVRRSQLWSYSRANHAVRFALET